MLRLSLVRPIAALILLLVAGSCAQPPPRQKFADLTWSHVTPFKLNVARIEVVSEFKPTFKPPHVEHLFPIPPEKAVRQWIEDRLLAAGPSGVAKVIIKDASVTEAELPKVEDLKGYFTTEQGQRYDIVVDVVIEVYGDRGFKQAFATARSERSQTVPEDITLNDRERTWYDLTESAMRDFNAEMEKNIPLFLKSALL
ncbi:MAG: hypothetical protein WCF16_09525 [Alphaproteobacteria bacterium]